MPKQFIRKRNNIMKKRQIKKKNNQTTQQHLLKTERVDPYHVLVVVCCLDTVYDYHRDKELQFAVGFLVG